MIEEYGLVTMLQILLRAFLFDLDQEIANPVWRFSWTSRNPGEWGTGLQSGKVRFLTKAYSV